MVLFLKCIFFTVFIYAPREIPHMCKPTWQWTCFWFCFWKLFGCKNKHLSPFICSRLVCYLPSYCVLSSHVLISESGKIVWFYPALPPSLLLVVWRKRDTQVRLNMCILTHVRCQCVSGYFSGAATCSWWVLPWPSQCFCPPYLTYLLSACVPSPPLSEACKQTLVNILKLPKHVFALQE